MEEVLHVIADNRMNIAESSDSDYENLGEHDPDYIFNHVSEENANSDSAGEEMQQSKG